MAVSTRRLPRATRRPERAAANSSGRCKRAAAGNVARDIQQSTEKKTEVFETEKALDGQTLAALGAASVDHGAATTGFHANAETMGTFATGDGRLVGTFHDGLARSKSEEKRGLSGFIPESPPFHQNLLV